MKKIRMSLYLLASLIIGILINVFNAYTIKFLIVSSLIFAVLIFIAIFLFYKSKQKSKKRILYILGTIILFITITFSALIVNIINSRCIIGDSPAKITLRTNIITGQCLVKISYCSYGDERWYYKPGCDISEDSKIDLIQKNKKYEKIESKCIKYCQESLDTDAGWPRISYCHPSFIGEEITCDDLMDCESIDCSSVSRKSTVVPKQTREYCESEDAEYKNLLGGCMDICSYKRKTIVQNCSTINTQWGCYCGESRCWNGWECEDL
jgi:hypothetical protein